MSFKSNNVTQAKLGTNDLGYDAWGRPKVINDFSLFSALWSFSVPNRIWLQYNDVGSGFVEQSQIDNNLVKSTHGHLEVRGNNVTDTYLRSKRHPRYQANRGLLYSTAVVLPDPDFVGDRDFGLINNDSSVCFRLTGTGASWSLNVVKKTTLSGVPSETVIDITALVMEKIPTFDPSKGHVYDIQMEWRGVGDFFIYVDLQLVYTFELLGTLTELSVTNPALPIGFRCSGAAVGNDLLIHAGCVDVTAEGGSKQNKEYTSASTGDLLLTTNNLGVALFAVRLPHLVNYDGGTVSYTRDMILTELSSFCKDEAFVKFHFSRLIHVANLEALAGWTVNADSLYEWKDNTGGALDTAFQLDKASMQNVYSIRGEKDIKLSHKNPDPQHTDFYLTAGDIVVVEIKSDGNSTGGCTLEFAEEV